MRGERARSLYNAALCRARHGVAWARTRLSSAAPVVDGRVVVDSTLPTTLRPPRRWPLPTTLPKPSAPPSPFLPSEIKYSASLVRAQAATHLVLGVLLLVVGVLGTRHGAPAATSAGLWCGMAAITCGVCGFLAHKLWYKNWAIKVYFISANLVIALTVVGLGVTFYYAMATAHLYAAYSYYNGYYTSNLFDEKLNGTTIKDIFFEEPPTPQSKNLVGNLILALSVEMIAAVWSLIVAWRGVRADEFTTTRREELVKETCSKAPTVNMISETGTTGSMPLAALYNLLQTHPELLSSKSQWRPDYPRAASQASMDYHERVARYLSQAHQPDLLTESNSPISVTTCERRKRSVSACETQDKDKRPTSKRQSRSKSEYRTKSENTNLNQEREKNLKNVQRDVVSQEYIKSSKPSFSPIESESPESQTDSTPSSTLTRLESSESNEMLNNDVAEGKQSQYLKLSLKTLSPLSTHVINPSEMIPRKGTQILASQYITRKSVSDDSNSASLSLQESDSEFNVSFTHSLGRPPPLPKKEYAKPKFVLNQNLHNATSNPSDSNDKSIIVPIKKKIKSSSKQRTSLNELVLSEREKQGTESQKRADSVVAPVVGAVVITVPETKTTTLQRKRKEKPPPPIPEKFDHTSAPRTISQDIKLPSSEESGMAIKENTYENIVQLMNDNRIYNNVETFSAKNDPLSNITIKQKESAIRVNKTIVREPLSIEIKPYETRNIIIGRNYPSCELNNVLSLT